MNGVIAKFRAYLAADDTWWHNKVDKGLSGPVAYFSAEFGFHESFPNYSGGLGILSGDHCKSASDLGLPFVAISLLYRHGYFKQQINKDGWQESLELNQNFTHLPVREVRNDKGEPIVVRVQLIDRSGRGEGVATRDRAHHAATCWTRIFRTTRRRIARSPRSSMVVTTSGASSRRSCSGSAACMR
jgi:hypothetical protein